MAGPGDILITIGAKTAEAVGELGHLNRALEKTATTGDKIKSGLAKAALPAAAALTGLTAAAVSAGKAAMEDAALYAHFETALGNTEQATGVADDQLVPAFEALARATGDTTEAQGLMNQVLDISAATGKDVETVANAVAKAHEGQTMALAKLA